MKNILVVGLGNPGSEYEGTRHNLGIMAVRAWVTDAEESGMPVRAWREDTGARAQIAHISLPEARVTCLFPLTFKNDSGLAVATHIRNSGLSVQDCIVVHDELELELGQAQVQAEGSARGHNGVRSIFDHLGTQKIPRLRLGIGRPPEQIEVSAYVLQRFSKEEQTIIASTTIPAAVEELSQFIGSRLAT